MLKQLLLALKRLLRALGPVLVGCIFLGAVYLLYREISKYSLADIRMSLAQISTGSIILSVLLAIYGPARRIRTMSVTETIGTQ